MEETNIQRYNHIHAQVDGYYSAAMKAYVLQRRAFMRSIKNEQIKSQQSFIRQLNDQIANEVMSEDLSKGFDEAFSFIEDAVTATFEESRGREFFGTKSEGLLAQKMSSARLKDGKKDTLENYYKRLEKDIDRFLSTNYMTKNYLEKIIGELSLRPSTSNTKVIVNQFYGYAKRMMFQLALGENFSVSTVNYKKALKGYYREDLITNGLNSLLNKIGIAAYGTGAIPDEQGRQTTMDIYIGKQISTDNDKDILTMLEKKIQSMTNTQVSASTDMYEPAIGMQSKSWIEPWVEGKGGNRTFLSVGSRSSLLNSIYPKGLRSWHDGVLTAAEHMREILGVNNVLYSTGSGVKWTADLIRQMRENNLFLAFYISKISGQATGEVVWQPDPGHGSK